MCIDVSSIKHVFNKRSWGVMLFTTNPSWNRMAPTLPTQIPEKVIYFGYNWLIWQFVLFWHRARKTHSSHNISHYENPLCGIGKPTIQSICYHATVCQGTSCIYNLLLFKKNLLCMMYRWPLNVCKAIPYL